MICSSVNRFFIAVPLWNGLYTVTVLNAGSRSLNRIVVMWLDFAEDQARRRKEIFLNDWAEKLDAFLMFNDRNVLTDAGHISKNQADAHAEHEYERFAARRRALLEAEGAEFNVRVLEDAAKALPESEKKKKK
nr:RhuM family protein [Burkholderia ubonensis]